MPLYEYSCTNCGLVHEELRSQATRDHQCEHACECGHDIFERVISATPGVVKNPAAPKKNTWKSPKY